MRYPNILMTAAVPYPVPNAFAYLFIFDQYRTSSVVYVGISQAQQYSCYQER